YRSTVTVRALTAGSVRPLVSAHPRGAERLSIIRRSQPIGAISLGGKIRSAEEICMSGSQQPKNYLHVLSLLALCPSRAGEVISYFAGLDSHGRNQLLALTDSHHVVLRALQPLGQAATRAGLAEIAQFAQEIGRASCRERV